MRHGKKNNHLSRKTSHRKALLTNLANSLILSKRITTTLAKAKELRKFVEPLVTKSKQDTTHSRRVVFSYLSNKYTVTELFENISKTVGDRPGGYTRIIKTGSRLGDNAEMAIIELVDYNELLLDKEKSATKKKTRRRGGKKKAATASAVSDAEVVEETTSPKEETPSSKEETTAPEEETKSE